MHNNIGARKRIRLRGKFRHRKSRIVKDDVGSVRKCPPKDHRLSVIALGVQGRSSASSSFQIDPLYASATHNPRTRTQSSYAHRKQKRSRNLIRTTEARKMALSRGFKSSRLFFPLRIKISLGLSSVDGLIYRDRVWDIFYVESVDQVLIYVN